MTVAGLIRVLQQALTKGVVRGKSGKACGYVVINAFGIMAVMVYLPTLAPVGVADRFQSLWGLFSQCLL